MPKYFLYAFICAQQVYVASTIDYKPRRLFLRHYDGDHHATSAAVAALKAIPREPQFFRLETIELPDRPAAYARCIAWSMRFADIGYSLPSDADRRRVEHPTPAEVAHYDAICHHDLRAICSPALDLAPALLAARKGPREQHEVRTVRVQIPAALYQPLRKQASRAGLRVGEWLLRGVQEHPPAQVDLRTVLECTDTIRQVLALLRSISLDAQRTRTYDKATLAQILAVSTEIAASLEQANQRLHVLCCELRRGRTNGTGGG